MQQTFRNYYYSLNFLLLIFPIQISVTYGKAKLKQAVSQAQSMSYWLSVLFQIFLLETNCIWLIVLQGGMCIVSSISVLSLKKDWFTSCFFFQFASLIDIVMLENNPLITMAVVLREVVLQEALNKPTEQSVLYLSIIILKEIGCICQASGCFMIVPDALWASLTGCISGFSW